MILLMSVIKHSQSTQSNKFVIFLQYLKKEVRCGVHFLHADKHQSVYKLALLFLMIIFIIFKRILIAFVTENYFKNGRVEKKYYILIFDNVSMVLVDNVKANWNFEILINSFEELIIDQINIFKIRGGRKVMKKYTTLGSIFEMVINTADWRYIHK